MLSKRERDYRNKIIAENHFKKDEQLYLDQYVNNTFVTYKKVYSNYEYLLNMLVKCNFYKLGNAMIDIGISCAQATKAFQNLSNANGFKKEAILVSWSSV